MATIPLKPTTPFRKDEMARLINIVREAKKHPEENDKHDDNDKNYNYDDHVNVNHENNDRNADDDSRSQKDDEVAKSDHYDDKLNHLVRENNIFVPKYQSEKTRGNYLKRNHKIEVKPSIKAFRNGMDLINKLISDKKILITNNEVANPLDLSYFDLLNEKNAIKKPDQNYKLLLERSKPAAEDVRLYYIRNPSIIDEYKNKIVDRRGKKSRSTSSSSDLSDVSGLSYDTDTNSAVFTSLSSDESYSDSDYIDEYSKRRNAAFRLGRKFGASENQNSKLHLRIGNNRYENYEKHTPQSFEKEENDKSIIAFKERNREDFYGKPRKDEKNRNKARDYDSPKRGGGWYEKSKKKNNDVFWDENSNKNRDSYNYKKEDNYENDDRYKNDNKHYVKGDYYKKDDNNSNDNKKNKKVDYYKNDDYNRDGHKNRKKDDYFKNDENGNHKKLDSYNDKKKYNEDYDIKSWNKKDTKTTKEPKKDDWNKPLKSDSWDNWKPQKSQVRDRKRDDDWRDKEVTKKQANRETVKRKDYYKENDNDYKKYGIEYQKSRQKPTSELEKTVPSRSESNPKGNKSYVDKISQYYYPKPKSPDNRQKGNGHKGFGRTSIPFVGKKGIYEDNK